MKSQGRLEREFDARSAVARLRSYAQQAKLDIDVHAVGQNLKTWTCQLSDSKGQASIGRGKGIGEQGLASAIAEALEHYWHTFEATEHFIRLKRFRTSDSTDLEKISPDFSLLFSNREVTFDCLKFESFDGKHADVFFPAVFQNPGYESIGQAEREVVKRSKVFRYSTNSGTAAGLSLDEAWLHGLLEAIERDAVGLSLLGSVIAQRPSPVRAINAASLGESLGMLFSQVEAEAGAGSVSLWDISSDTGVATILCGLTVYGPCGCYRYFGSGASLSAEYAVERSLLEALQGFHIHQILQEFYQAPLDDNKAKKMSLYRSCELDAGYFEYRGGEVMIEFSDIPNHGSMNLSAQISLLAERLSNIGCPPYRRAIHKSDLLAIGQVVVPNFERFYLVSHGLSVAPSWRGRQLLEKLV